VRPSSQKTDIRVRIKYACIRKADEAEYMHLLRQKLLEEVNEFMESGSTYLFLSFPEGQCYNK
jgi:hypothetical protein